MEKNDHFFIQVYCSDKGLEGTVVNKECHCLNAESLKITFSFEIQRH